MSLRHKMSDDTKLYWGINWKKKFFAAAAVATSGLETAPVAVVERKHNTFEDQKAVVNSVCIFLLSVSTENLQFLPLTCLATLTFVVSVAVRARACVCVFIVSSLCEIMQLFFYTWNVLKVNIKWLVQVTSCKSTQRVNILKNTQTRQGFLVCVKRTTSEQTHFFSTTSWKLFKCLGAEIETRVRLCAPSSTDSAYWDKRGAKTDKLGRENDVSPSLWNISLRLFTKVRLIPLLKSHSL